MRRASCVVFLFLELPPKHITWSMHFLHHRNQRISVHVQPTQRFPVAVLPATSRTTFARAVHLCALDI